MAEKKAAPMTMELFEALEKNEVRIGGKITGLRVVEGNPRTDKEGNPMYNPDGSPMLWNDSYYVEFAFQGGVANFKVDSSIYADLEEGKRYQMVGIVFMKTPYGDGKPYPAIEPKRFELLF